MFISFHHKLLVIFKEMFPGVPVLMYWRKGNSAIRVRTIATEQRVPYDVVFTYFDDTDWKLESSAMYERLKKNHIQVGKLSFNP